MALLYFLGIIVGAEFQLAEIKFAGRILNRRIRFFLRLCRSGLCLLRILRGSGLLCLLLRADQMLSLCQFDQRLCLRLIYRRYARDEFNRALPGRFQQMCIRDRYCRVIPASPCCIRDPIL